jgi:hypothetical protein
MVDTEKIWQLPIQTTEISSKQINGFSNYPLMSHLQLADLQKIDAADKWPCRGGGIPKTLRFDPVTSQTSGLFVAKFTKLT